MFAVASLTKETIHLSKRVVECLCFWGRLGMSNIVVVLHSWLMGLSISPLIACVYKHHLTSAAPSVVGTLDIFLEFLFRHLKSFKHCLSQKNT